MNLHYIFIRHAFIGVNNEKRTTGAPMHCVFLQSLRLDFSMNEPNYRDFGKY